MPLIRIGDVRLPGHRKADCNEGISMSSTIGTLYKVSTFGESHGKAVGATVDGCPANLALSEADACEAGRRTARAVFTKLQKLSRLSSDSPS